MSTVTLKRIENFNGNSWLKFLVSLWKFRVVLLLEDDRQDIFDSATKTRIVLVQLPMINVLTLQAASILLHS